MILPKRVKTGERITAAWGNSVRDWAVRDFGGNAGFADAVTSLIRQAASQPPVETLAWYKIIVVAQYQESNAQGGHLVVRKLKGLFANAEVEATAVTAALPYLLRPQINSRAGIDYTSKDYTTTRQKRIATLQSDPDQTQTEVITPSYRANDWILALRFDTGLEFQEKKIELLDINIDGRHWAQE